MLCISSYHWDNAIACGTIDRFLLEISFLSEPACQCTNFFAVGPQLSTSFKYKNGLLIHCGRVEKENINNARVLENMGSKWNVSLYAGSFLQLNGPGTLHSSQQLSSPLHLQQRNESSFDDRHKVSVASSNDIKPVVSSAGQTSGVPVGEASGVQKVSL